LSKSNILSLDYAEHPGLKDFFKSPIKSIYKSIKNVVLWKKIDRATSTAKKLKFELGNHLEIMNFSPTDNSKLTLNYINSNYVLEKAEPSMPKAGNIYKRVSERMPEMYPN